MDDSLIEEFYRILHRLHQCRPCFMKHGELTNVEFFILMEISILLDGEHDGITLGDVIKSTDMTMSAASKKITILEKKGLIKRQASKKDRRHINIVLTPLGHELCEEEKRKKREWMSMILSRMGTDDSLQMFTLFNKMLDVVEDIESDTAEGAELC